MSDYAIVYVTCPDKDAARNIAHEALQQKLCACANIVPQVESIYTWENKTEISAEVLMIIKTSTGCLNALEKLVIQHHPYDVPEFIVSNITQGHKPYLNWISETTKTS